MDARIGRTPLTALYDLAIGQFPFSNHSFPSASCVDESPCMEAEFIRENNVYIISNDDLSHAGTKTKNKLSK